MVSHSTHTHWVLIRDRSLPLQAGMFVAVGRVAWLLSVTFLPGRGVVGFTGIPRRAIAFLDVGGPAWRGCCLGRANPSLAPAVAPRLATAMVR